MSRRRKRGIPRGVEIISLQTIVIIGGEEGEQELGDILPDTRVNLAELLESVPTDQIVAIMRGLSEDEDTIAAVLEKIGRKEPE